MEFDINRVKNTVGVLVAALDRQDIPVEARNVMLEALGCFAAALPLPRDEFDGDATAGEPDASKGSELAASESDEDTLGPTRVLNVPQFLGLPPTAYWCMCVAARRGSGKTVLIQQIARAMLAKQSIKDVVVFTSAPAGARAACGSLGAVVHDFNDALVAELRDRVEARLRAGKRVSSKLLIFDDVSDDLGRSKAVKQLFLNGRHQYFYVIAASQESNRTLAPAYKHNSDFILFSRGTDLKDLREYFLLDRRLTPRELEEWTAANVGGSEHVFGLYARSYGRLMRVGASVPK